jgi:hypothetical protein
LPKGKFGIAGKLYQWQYLYANCIAPMSYKTQFALLSCAYALVALLAYTMISHSYKVGAPTCSTIINCAWAYGPYAYVFLLYIIVITFLCALAIFLLGIAKRLREYYAKWTPILKTKPQTNSDEFCKFATEFQSFVECLTEFNSIFSLMLTVIICFYGLVFVLWGYLLCVSNAPYSVGDFVGGLLVMMYDVLLIVIPATIVNDRVSYAFWPWVAKNSPKVFLTC